MQLPHKKSKSGEQRKNEESETWRDLVKVVFSPEGLDALSTQVWKEVAEARAEHRRLARLNLTPCDAGKGMCDVCKRRTSDEPSAKRRKSVLAGHCDAAPGSRSHGPVDRGTASNARLAGAVLG